MNFIVDVNLSPLWCVALKHQGHHAQHWSEIGDIRASDASIMEWAARHDTVVLTQDLDFGELLAANALLGPSVVILGGHSVSPQAVSATVLLALKNFHEELARGALLRIEPGRARIRLLPIRDGGKGE